MRILFCSQRVPFPPNRGDKITTYHEILHLSKKHEVEVFCLSEGKKDQKNIDELRKIVPIVVDVPLKILFAKIRSLLFLVTTRPLTLPYYFESRLKRLITKRHQEKPFDLAFSFSSSMAQYIEHLTDVPKIVQYGDLDSLKWKQYATNSSFPQKLVYKREETFLLQYERKISRSFDYSIVCTHAEKKDAEKLIPDTRIGCVGNGVNLDFFKPDHKVQKVNYNLVFTGVMDYLPNIDAVIWFANEVFPLIQKKYPEATFTICGSSPSTEVSALSKIKGVEVTGWVQDVRSYLNKAHICVIPLRMGRGIQNKLLEAMAMELPCVTTSLITQGLEPELKNGIRIADSAVDFSNEVVKAFELTSVVSKEGLYNRKMIEKYYTWEYHNKSLDKIIDTVISDKK